MKLGYLALFLFLFATPVYADSAAADCTVTPAGETVEGAKRPCMFSQRQGYVDLRYDGEDANFLELTPIEGIGSYTDQNGKFAFRQKGLGDKGQVFRTELGIVRVYWK